MAIIVVMFIVTHHCQNIRNISIYHKYCVKKCFVYILDLLNVWCVGKVITLHIL
jgi:hypothetical protein